MVTTATKNSKETIASSYDYIYNFDSSALKLAKALQQEGREYRKAEIERVKDTMYAEKIALKYFPNGIKKFDISIFEHLFSKDDKLNNELETKYQELFAAKDRKDKSKIKKTYNEIRC